jgi:hypothetical protein
MTQPIQDPTDPTRWLIGDAIVVLDVHAPPPVVIANVHSASACAGRACVMHNPSAHHMRAWPLTWRNDKGVFERHCEHGVGHPDPDDAAWHTMIARRDLNVHGCDGCCP